MLWALCWVTMPAYAGDAERPEPERIAVTVKIVTPGPGRTPRFPVRITGPNGVRYAPEDARIPLLYQTRPKPNEPPNVYFYLTEQAELRLPVGEVTFEVACEFEYHPFKKTVTIDRTMRQVELKLSPWPDGERMAAEHLPVGRRAYRTYRSPLDGCLLGYLIGVPKDYDPAKPVMLHVSLHGHGGARRQMEGGTPYMGWHRPTYPHAGRIDILTDCRGTHYQGMGEFEFFYLLKSLQKAYAIDADRIHLSGSSMGGAGAYHLGIRYPDVFASVTAKNGYLDYRVLQETAREVAAEGKQYRDGPKGRIVRTLPPERLAFWRKMNNLRIAPIERPLLKRQSGIFVIENTMHLPLLMVHGAYDSSVFGGVDVMHARRAWARLQALGYKDKWYVERGDDGLGHGGPFEMADGGPKISRRPSTVRPPEEQARYPKEDLLALRRVRYPARVVYKTNTLSYHKAYWVQIDLLQPHWHDATIDATRSGPATFTVSTTNVRQFTLTLAPELIGRSRAVTVSIDGHVLQALPVPADRLLTLRRDGSGGWSVPEARWPAGLLKRPGLQGPIINAFHQPHILVAAGKAGRAAAEAFGRTLNATQGGWFCSLMPCRGYYEPALFDEETIRPTQTRPKSVSAPIHARWPKPAGLSYIPMPQRALRRASPAPTNPPRDALTRRSRPKRLKMARKSQNRVTQSE